MPRYVDLNNPKIIHTGRDKFGDGIYHIPPDLPTADVVERSAYDQVRLERDTAITQLAEIGKGFGETMGDVVERKKGKWIDITKGGGNFLWKCSECGELELNDTYFCPNCGADMREESDNG